MKKAYIFVFGGSSTLLLSTFLFFVVPRLQVDPLLKAGVSAQRPYSEQELRGRHKYLEYGCVYCHTQQVRDPSVGADKTFGWGRASLPSDYIYDNPHLMGTSRTGPDLSNIGSRQPSRDWLHVHFYNPRILVPWSIMPPFPFLYGVLESSTAPTPNAVAFPGAPTRWLIPSPAAEDLVVYLQSLKRDLGPIQQEKPK
jgi:cytochrome c oxidase cbb3-type subunit 2